MSNKIVFYEVVKEYRYSLSAKLVLFFAKASKLFEENWGVNKATCTLLFQQYKSTYTIAEAPRTTMANT